MDKDGAKIIATDVSWDKGGNKNPVMCPQDETSGRESTALIASFNHWSLVLALTEYRDLIREDQCWDFGSERVNCKKLKIKHGFKCTEFGIIEASFAIFLELANLGPQVGYLVVMKPIFNFKRKINSPSKKV